MEIPKFYLRQTVPLTLQDLLFLPRLFMRRNRFTANLVESKLSDKIGIKYSVLCSSMRLGLLKSLEYYKNKFPEKNEVLLPEYSFYSNLEAVLKLGLKVKYVPVERKTLEIDLRRLPSYININTLAVIITHIHGFAYPMDKLVKIVGKNNTLLFEDCAHVFGENFGNKKLGSFGIGCFSFGPGKNMTCFGGGAVCTNDKKLYAELKEIQTPKKGLLEDLKTFAMTVVYVLISHPIISYFSMKPLLKIVDSLGIKKEKHQLGEIQRTIPKTLNSPYPFQITLLNYELSHIYKRINIILTQRRKIADIYRRFFSTDRSDNQGNFNFQFPLSVADKKIFISKARLVNLDVQEDYCDYLPNLYKADIRHPNYGPYKNIVYLPVNYFLSESKLRSILAKIF